jgi:hypothetical protein
VFSRELLGRRNLSASVLAFACSFAVALPAAGAAVPVGPDPAFTQQLLALDVTASPPPARPDDFLGLVNTPENECATVSGRIVWRARSGEVPARGLRVFLMAADDYTSWFAARSSADALADKDAVETLDATVRSRALASTVADRFGVFLFPSRAPGEYILFAVLHETIGFAVPSERVERGWDDRGHGADVVVPSIEIPQSHVVSARYLYGFTLRAEERPWNLGIVRPNSILRDGRPLGAPKP